jgi:DNA polymerase-3 subunit gamma/tau
MANDCDLKYKTSKNQRLLVELTLMQIASIDFDGEKKKSEYYIIPSSHFAGRIVEEKADLDREYIKDKIHDTPVESPAQPVIKQQTIVTELVKPEPPVLKKADPGNKRLRKSALSINSLNRKKEEEAAQRNRESMPQDHEDLPVDSFTDTAFFNAWNEFIDILLKDGKKIHASILKADKPKVEGNLIHVTYANKLMADELNMIKPKTLKYLRTRLNNFSLKFKVNINEEQANKVAYTTLEKYDLLKSKNPDLDLLKKTFKLDL